MASFPSIGKRVLATERTDPSSQANEGFLARLKGFRVGFVAHRLPHGHHALADSCLTIARTASIEVRDRSSSTESKIGRSLVKCVIVSSSRTRRDARARLTARGLATLTL